MFWKNTQRRLDAAGLLLAHAKAKGITNAAKSSYYRSASILLATVVEGMVYELVKKHTTSPHTVGDTLDHKERHRISAHVFSTTGDLTICEKVKRNILIDDEGVGFGKLNVFLKNKKLITQAEYRLLDWVRKERNRVHLQGLNTSDTGYTKAKIEKIAKALILLIRKLT